MESVKKYFDDFVFSARVMPAMTAGLPLLILAVYNGIVANSWSEASTSFALAIILIAFSAYIAREWGKNYEGMMLSRLVDTFFSRTSWTMLLYAENHSISVA